MSGFKPIADAGVGTVPTQISAKIICDSLAPNKARLTTFEFTAPRFILAEINTHRMLSRNAASSRAIPIDKMLERVLTDPAFPVEWGKNQAGMQATAVLEGDDVGKARRIWCEAMQDAVMNARRLQALGVHKQIVNRLVEPFMWCKQIVTATEWGNFFWQRCHKDAQPEFRTLAELACAAYYGNTPEPLVCDGWHLPYFRAEDWTTLAEEFRGDDPRDLACQISTARCARVSYLTHDGVRDLAKDIELFQRLLGGSGGAGHWSPLEHVATPAKHRHHHSGNFRGWVQYRKFFPRETMDTLLVSPNEYSTRA